jgi:hypothetical protein
MMCVIVMAWPKFSKTVKKEENPKVQRKSNAGTTLVIEKFRL